MSADQLTAHPLKVLRQSGIITEVEGRLKFVIPEFEPVRHKEKWEPSKKAAPSLADSARLVLDEFKRLWGIQYHGNCIVTGKDRTSAVNLTKELGLQEVLARLQGYLACRDNWLKERAHPFAVFAKTSNKYCRRADGESTAGIIQHDAEFEAEVREFEEAQRRA